MTALLLSFGDSRQTSILTLAIIVKILSRSVLAASLQVLLCSFFWKPSDVVFLLLCSCRWRIWRRKNLCIYFVDRVRDSHEAAPSIEELHCINVDAGKLVWVSFWARSKMAKLFESSVNDFFVMVHMERSYDQSSLQISLYYNWSELHSQPPTFCCRYIYLGLFDSEIEAARYCI